jgi:hypothetical protein
MWRAGPFTVLSAIDSPAGGGSNPLYALICLLLTAGCAAVPFEQTGALSSYQSLAPADGVLTRAKVSVNASEVLAARTVQIVPTSFSEPAARAGLSDTQRQMVANAIDRSVCIGLSDRFQIVGTGQPADLSVHAVVTHVGLTDETMAGVSKAVSVGATVVEKVFVPIPIPTPSVRIPIGLGGLSVEAEAVDPQRRQQAAMVWARGADAFTSKPKVSAAGDAYDLAKAFADDFSKLLVTAASPFRKMPSLPSMHKVGSMLGGAPKEAACEAFGRGPGVTGLVADTIGLPPEWTDKGAAAAAPALADNSLQ